MYLYLVSLFLVLTDQVLEFLQLLGNGFSLRNVLVCKDNISIFRGFSSVVERSLCMREVMGSNPITSIFFRRPVFFP